MIIEWEGSNLVDTIANYNYFNPSDKCQASLNSGTSDIGNSWLDTPFNHDIIMIQFWLARLANRILCIAITKHKSNLLTIRAQVPLSNVEKQQLIVEDSTADPPLTFVASILFRVIATLWTSLVAWSRTSLSFWFIEPVIQALEKLLRDCRLSSLFLTHSAV